jgi:exodeoxyribonuclease VII small subunit
MAKTSSAPAASAPTAPTSATLPTPLTEPLPETYEAALSELERLVGAMEAGQLPLDRLLGTYRRGAELLNFCRTRLDAVEQQVKVLEDGQLKPWNPT